MAGLGLATLWPQVADAARKEGRRPRNEDHRENDANDRHHDGRASHQNAGRADGDKNADARRETSDAGGPDTASDETVKGRIRTRLEQRGGNDDGRSTTEADGGGTRRESRRQDATTESTDTSRTQDGARNNAGEDHRVRAVEQRAEDVVVVDEPAPTSIPDAPMADLLVEENSGVIAGVSRSGAYAFSRSGDVTAISGPYGASVTSGDVTAISGPYGAYLVGPDEPSTDGGNNDPDFIS